MPTILITGGSRGIGRATALLAGARGWNVGVNYVRDAESAQSAVAEIERSGGHALALKGDATSETDVRSMFDALEAQFGGVSGVVINAGISAPVSKIQDFTTERLRKVLDTNILGACFCAREAARRLITEGGAGGDEAPNRNIVFVSSVASRLGSPNEYVDYAASKGAVDSMTIGLSKELGPEGVRVNCVRPGIIKTDIHATTGVPGRADTQGATCPLGRAGEASEVGEAIVWLLSDKASYVTGAILDVSGGR